MVAGNKNTRQAGTYLKAFPTRNTKKSIISVLLSVQFFHFISINIIYCEFLNVNGLLEGMRGLRPLSPGVRAARACGARFMESMLRKMRTAHFPQHTLHCIYGEAARPLMSIGVWKQALRSCCSTYSPLHIRRSRASIHIYWCVETGASLILLNILSIAYTAEPREHSYLLVCGNRRAAPVSTHQ
jgi:hypothetical protein